MSEHERFNPAVIGSGASVTLRVKVVPGASRDRVMGMLGDRLKLSVASPPEGGKANKAVCALVADALHIPVRDVEVSAGTSNPQKTLMISGLTAQQVVERLIGGGPL